MMKPALLLISMALLVSCDPEEDPNTVDCDTLELTYENFGAGFMDTFCNTCHSGTLTGPDRQFAPTSVNFDTQEEVLDQLLRIKVRTVDMRTMPPTRSTPQPEAAETVDLGRWLDCGAP